MVLATVDDALVRMVRFSRPLELHIPILLDILHLYTAGWVHLQEAKAGEGLLFQG